MGPKTAGPKGGAAAAPPCAAGAAAAPPACSLPLPLPLLPLPLLAGWRAASACLGFRV
jgi:hypothetical protein